MTARVLVVIGLVAMLATGCAVRTGAYIGPVAPVGYYGAPAYVGAYDAYRPYPYVGYASPYVVGRPYVVARPYVGVAPRAYRPAPRFAYRASRRGRW